MCLFIEVENSNKSQRKEDEFFLEERILSRVWGNVYVPKCKT